MASSFYLTEKARRRSCHRRNDSVELDVFEADRCFSTATESLGHRCTTLSHKIGLPTRDQLGHETVSLDMPMMMRPPQDTFLDTLNPPKAKKKHKSPSSPGGKLASFFNSLISQTVSEKKKQSKSSPQSVKDLVEDESPSGWRRRRTSISHFRSSASSTAASFSAVFVSRKPNTAAPRVKRTSMSDIESKSIESCPSISGFWTPPPYLINTPINPYKHTNMNPSAKVQNEFKFVKGLSERRSSRDFERHVAGSEERSWVDRSSSSQESKEFKRFVEEDDGGESDSSSDLFELKLNYDHHQLGYCGGGLPVYESTHMDSIKISSANPITNGPFRKI